MKNYRKILHYLASPFVLGCVVTFTIVFGASLYYSRYQDAVYEGESKFFDVFRELHQKTIDYRMVIRGQIPGHRDVAVLAIDEPSLEQEGRWPWPREKIGRVVEKAVNYGAKTVAFDIIFAESDSNSSKRTLTRLQNVLGEKRVLTPELKSVFGTEIEAADSDQKFGTQIGKYADHLLMGAYFEEANHADLERVSQNVDICLDSLYSRSTAANYWKRDQRPPIVVDSNAKEQTLPAPLAEHLDGYLSLLETKQITKWFEENQDVKAKLKNIVVAHGFPEEMELEHLLVSFVTEDNIPALNYLEAVTGQSYPTEQLDALFSKFAPVVTQKHIAIIQHELRQSTLQYCYRFLNDQHKDNALNDELLVKEAFANRHPELLDSYDQLAWADKWTALNKEGVELPFGEFSDYLKQIRLVARRNHITPIDRWWLNIPVLAATTKYTSFFNAHLDSDGTVRRNMFLARRGNNYFTSLALGAFLISRDLSASAMIVPTTDGLYKGIPLEFETIANIQNLAKLESAERNPAQASTQEGFQIMNANGEAVMSIPVDPGAKMLINYSGAKHTFPHISAADLLSDKETAVIKINRRDPASGGRILEETVNKKEFLKDKVLFFGATATGIYDLRVTPFEENFPGVETHANMLSNLLVEYARATGKADTVKGMPGFLRTYPEHEAKLMLPLMLIFGLIFSALLTYFGSIAGLGITTASLGGLVAIDKFILFDSGIVITVLLPFSLIMSLFVTLTFYKYFTEERKKRQLKGTFAKYVSPAIVDEILADPENIELGGKKMELTVMFSDVRGFTTISEKLDPRALSDLLNSYLTPMTNLVFENKGTLDKYMGDAIMAFWGAPVHFNDHAAHASRCALQMLDKLKELQAQYKEQGLPTIDIGIGLNTGEMSVGNMGSDTVRSYTVMGDAVNLGSRLEGINKQYGTRIIISEFTHKSIAEQFVCREIDWVRVKGKAQPVKIFELVGETGKVSEATLKLMKTFGDGIHAYHSKEWDRAIGLFTDCLHMNPDDEPSQLYLERCQEYKNNPPPADWDGVFTMTTK